MCSKINELYKIMPQNGVYVIASSKKKEEFSPYESQRIGRILNEIKYIMDRVMCDSGGRFIGTFSSYVKLEKSNKSLFLYYKEHYISFTKYEDDYILITFGRDNMSGWSNNLRATNNTHDVRFGVMCDDLDGVFDFYREQMLVDNFIPKIMLGEKL